VSHSISSPVSAPSTSYSPYEEPGRALRARLARAALLAATVVATGLLSGCGGPLDAPDEPARAVLRSQGNSGGGGAASSAPLSFAPASLVAGGAATVTVTLADVARNPAGVVVYVTLPPAVLAGPKVITVPSGQQSASFPVYASPYLAAPTAASVTWRTSTPNLPELHSATLQVAAASPPPAGSLPVVTAVLLDASSVVSGTPVGGAITLSGPAPAAGLAVRLAFSYDLFHQNGSIPDVLLVPAGASSAGFTVATHLAVAGATATSDFVVASAFGGPWAGAPLTIAAAP